MRLINVDTYKVKEFFGNASQVPDYAILSHTWGKDEVSLQDMQDLKKASAKEGFKKIEYCCKQAAEDGWKWAWVDTCCIDKTSSAELSEAINSMYKWYAASMMCYAYMNDVSSASEFLARTPRPANEDMPSSGTQHGELDPADKWAWSVPRWFSRGWTLQELIAPFTVIFYTSSWKRIGTKKEWSPYLSEVTGIPESILDHSTSISNVSVLNRMRWASKRQTTREEDTAYCLLGIFDVNMPLLYGEGSKAFERFQEQILRTTDDHTLFLWRILHGHEAANVITGRRLFLDYYSELCGMLAASPTDFDRTLPVTMTMFDEFSDPQMATRDLGLRLTLPIRQLNTADFSRIPHIQNLRTSIDNIYMAALGCQVNPSSDTLTEGVSGRVVLFLYRLKGSAQGGQPFLFCRIRFLFHVVPRGEASKWPRRTLYIRGPIRRKKKRLFNGIRQIGGSSYGYDITRRLKAHDWIDVTIGGTAAFLLESLEMSTSLFISCTIEVDRAFCYAVEIRGTPSEEEIDELWRETDKFETALIRPWEKIHARYGPIYMFSQKLGENIEPVLILKCEEGIDTDIINIYMKLNQ